MGGTPVGIADAAEMGVHHALRDSSGTGCVHDVAQILVNNRQIGAGRLLFGYAGPRRLLDKCVVFLSTCLLYTSDAADE